MNITIVGAGNIGTQLAVHSASTGHAVTVFTSKYDKISKELRIVDDNNDVVLSGTIANATDNAHEAFSKADLVFVTVPSFLMRRFADIIIPNIKCGAKICLVPGTGGGEFAFKEALEKECTVFGLQRVPSVARLTEYGKSVCATGYRSRLFTAAIPSGKAPECAKLISDIVGIECVAMPSYLNVTLTPSNPILHTARLKTVFKDYKEGMFYEKIPLFYEEWSLESSELLLKCDAEVQNICKALGEFDLSYVKSLKEHYESDTPEALTKKITSINSLKGLTTPSVSTPNGFLPDFSSRYFTADFSYGLIILIQIADFLKVNSDNMKETMAWYNTVTDNENVFDFKNYGIYSAEDFADFYKQ